MEQRRAQPTRAGPAADHGISRGLWVVLCLLFLASSLMSVTGLICLIGWIRTL